MRALLVAALSASAATLYISSIEAADRPQSVVDGAAAILRAQLAPAGTGTRPASRQRDLVRLYGLSDFAPIWVDGSGRPNASARDALGLLHESDGEGIPSSRYAPDVLSRTAESLSSTRPTAESIAAFDLALSARMLEYARDLHLGIVNPRSVGFQMDAPPEEEHDFVTLLHSAVIDARVGELPGTLAPPLVQYRALRAKLAEYRALAADERIQPIPASSLVVRPGDRCPWLDGLQQFLIAVGDLPPDMPPPTDDTYEGAIVDGVVRFQRRHGLEEDGVLGRKTQAALRVPLSWRARQIELSLERLRWLPDLGQGRFIVLNIPMFHLWGWDAIPPGGEPLFGMRAVVGRALSTQTPVFVAEIRRVIFRPYWNVPRSILRGEILPLVERDPSYLVRNGMEIVAATAGDRATPVEATPENIARLRQGTLRLRQRPGPNNALGLVKFDFPNDDNVYMHGTPAQTLFSRSRRDFSHGCIRVESPAALAAWVLREQPDWTPARIQAAMEGQATERVDVLRPIRVVLYYTTAAFMPEDGTIRFAEDIYRHDAALDRALARAQTPLPSEQQ